MWSLRRLAEEVCRPTAKGRIEGEQLVELEKLVASESGIKKVVLTWAPSFATARPISGSGSPENKVVMARRADGEGFKQDLPRIKFA